MWVTGCGNAPTAAKRSDQTPFQLIEQIDRTHVSPSDNSIVGDA
jgi:hypothetical protein